MTAPQATTTAADVIALVACPVCRGKIGGGCYWFYGYDKEYLHPERWADFRLYHAERAKLKAWNEAAKQ